jgi:hypothetical protein
MAGLFTFLLVSALGAAGLAANLPAGRRAATLWTVHSLGVGLALVAHDPPGGMLALMRAVEAAP